MCVCASSSKFLDGPQIQKRVLLLRQHCSIQAPLIQLLGRGRQNVEGLPAMIVPLQLALHRDVGIICSPNGELANASIDACGVLPYQKVADLLLVPAGVVDAQTARQSKTDVVRVCL